jgi:hemolysin III
VVVVAGAARPRGVAVGWLDSRGARVDERRLNQQADVMSGTGASSASASAMAGPESALPVPAAPVRSSSEEAWNAATHGAGLALAVAGAIVLGWAVVRRGGGAWQFVGSGIYAATLLAAYAASTISHVARRPGARRAWRIADQAIIFLFMAGTYTPVALTWLRGGPWWVLHGLVWAVALTGFASKAVFAHRVHLGAVSTTLYILLGWMPVLAIGPLLHALPAGLMWWFLAGGLCYTVGIAFFHYDHRVPYFHAAWHVLVLAGSACHYMAILLYCTGAGTAR